MDTELETSKGFDPFLSMDKLDDEAILAELKGRVLDKWTYHFNQDGKEIWGLSKVGVDQACSEMAKRGEVIRETSLTFQPDPTDNRYMLFVAMAARYAVSKDGKEVFLDQTVGTKRQCVYIMRGNKPTENSNNFFFEQGSMKAFRNARSRMISEETRARIVALSKEQGKVVEVRASDMTEVQPQQDNGPQGPQGPAVKSDIISEAQRKRFYAIAKASGKSDDEIKFFLAGKIGSESTNNITRTAYEKLCEEVSKP